MSPREPITRSRPNLLLRHRTAAFALLSALAVILLYAQSFTSPFVYDDLDGIVHNPNLTHRFLLAPVSFTNEFRSTTGSTWRPLFWLSLALDRRLFGLNPTPFHATNLLLHWINGLFLFTLLRRTLPGSPGSRHRPELLAAVTALLWLILPINSEAVAWISGRAYPLCLLFSSSASTPPSPGYGPPAPSP